MRTTYATLEYANAFGLPIIDVPEWETPVLVRTIPGSEWRDAQGCYPLCEISRDADLRGGLSRLRSSGLVSVVAVPNPLTAPSPTELARSFEHCLPFKTHYVIERKVDPVSLPATHRRWIRKALATHAIEKVDSRQNLEDWRRLYRLLVEQRRITGISDFPPAYFDALASLPGLVTFAARQGDRIAAMALWFDCGEIAYYHLGASTPEGYEAHAMYGIFQIARDYFHDRPLLHLGGAAGLSDAKADGLARFKRGFANREITAYLCGSPLDNERYAQLAGDQSGEFFPAYRHR